jgi:hypothetical protein
MDSEQVRVRIAAYQSYKPSDFGDSSKSRPHFVGMRMAQDDVVLCIWSCRVVRKRYEVGLFLAGDHFRYVPWSGVIGGLVFILSDAYYKTGSMEIRFCGPARGARPTWRSGFEAEIPPQIRQFATSASIRLPPGNVLPDAEARRLYVHITKLPRQTRHLLTRRNCDLPRVCFLVHRGIWTREQITLIAGFSENPAGILTGGSASEDCFHFQSERLLLRYGILHERIQMLLSGLLDQGRPRALCSWIQPNRARFQVREETFLPLRDGSRLSLPSGSLVEARFLARDAIGHKYFRKHDLELLAAPTDGVATVLVVTKDFDLVEEDLRQLLCRTADDRKIPLVSVIDTLSELDESVELKLFQTASSLRPVEERPE